jgi:hypothetical protein
MWFILNPINIFIEFLIYLFVDNITKFIVLQNKYVFKNLFTIRDKDIFIQERKSFLYIDLRMYDSWFFNWFYIIVVSYTICTYMFFVDSYRWNTLFGKRFGENQRNTSKIYSNLSIESFIIEDISNKKYSERIFI